MVSLPRPRLVGPMTSANRRVAGHAVRHWIVDVVLGSVLGAIVGAIAAVNLVIFSGTEDGYEASLGDVFGDQPIVGVMTVAILVGGPVAGVVVMRRRRTRRTGRTAVSSDLRL